MVGRGRGCVGCEVEVLGVSNGSNRILFKAFLEAGKQASKQAIKRLDSPPPLTYLAEQNTLLLYYDESIHCLPHP